MTCPICDESGKVSSCNDALTTPGMPKNVCESCLLSAKNAVNSCKTLRPTWIPLTIMEWRERVYTQRLNKGKRGPSGRPPNHLKVCRWTPSKFSAFARQHPTQALAAAEQLARRSAEYSGYPPSGALHRGPDGSTATPPFPPPIDGTCALHDCRTLAELADEEAELADEEAERAEEGNIRNPKSVPVNQADDASPFVATNEDVLIRRTINDWRHGLLPFEDARAAIEDRDLFDNALRQAGLERSLVLDLEWQALGKFRAHNSSRAISDLAAEDRERVQRALREEAVAGAFLMISDRILSTSEPVVPELDPDRIRPAQPLHPGTAPPAPPPSTQPV
ncbi:hypothetical protein B0A53_05249 [Rhodotorula sp. CCFEE 5036]|nr:hypothetical protein B0A53_05249 [Rhodotorula sp. CCFEE 5036]